MNGRELEKISEKNYRMGKDYDLNPKDQTKNVIFEYEVLFSLLFDACSVFLSNGLEIVLNDHGHNKSVVEMNVHDFYTRRSIYLLDIMKWKWTKITR